MNPIISIAYRYLRSKKSSSAVNIISYVSIAGISLAVTAMVVVMSVFNGFSRFTTANIEAVGSELSVYARSGKVIERADSLARVLGEIEGVATATPVLSEKAYAIAGDKQAPVTLTGVEAASPLIEQLSAKSIDGEAGLTGKTYGSYSQAIASLGAANSLMTVAETNAVKIYEPRRVGRINPANPMNAFRVDSV
ncbi:MAG: ABC transporter permease, partial [Muribaculaceae bacterium]|nr:ABC transporter permease [Muribaculaceae bacterium]